MSRWVRGIYNAAANFVMSRSLRAASGSSMGRNPKQLRAESDKSSECVESNQSCKPNQSNKLGQHSCYNHPARTCDCPAGTCDDDKPANLHVEGCICSLCRDYNEYVSHTASIRTEGQGAGSWIRLSYEPGNIKQSDSDATRTDIEYITGIRTGTTI